MELKNQQSIAASIEDVYRALNDPDILQACIPGCDSIEKISDTEMKATVTLKIGPIKASYLGDLAITDLNPPTNYTLVFTGKGGSVGDATGTAVVKLQAEEGGGTLIDYEVNADVSGKIAQVGGRLITSTAKLLSKKFFKSFSQQFAPDNSASDNSATDNEQAD